MSVSPDSREVVLRREPSLVRDEVMISALPMPPRSAPPVRSEARVARRRMVLPIPAASAIGWRIAALCQDANRVSPGVKARPDGVCLIGGESNLVPGEGDEEEFPVAGMAFQGAAELFL